MKKMIICVAKVLRFAAFFAAVLVPTFATMFASMYVVGSIMPLEASFIAKFIFVLCVFLPLVVEECAFVEVNLIAFYTKHVWPFKGMCECDYVKPFAVTMAIYREIKTA